jgi:uncharacterized protein YbjT (DUF2867 family)
MTDFPVNEFESLVRDFLAGIREENAIYLAAGDGRTSFISAHDIAAMVVVALQQSLTGREFDLTSSAALDHFQVAKIISEASGRRVVYHSLTEQQMLLGARSQGLPEPTVAYMAMLYAVVRAGLAASAAGEFETITGRKPMTFEAFARSAVVAWS